MNRSELDFLASRWDVFAHEHQLPPPLTTAGNSWLTWLLIGGRGAGKTRAGAEWIRAQVLGTPPLAIGTARHVALIGELILECAALWAVLVHEFWTRDLQTINALIGASGLLIAYWGFRFGVLGVYISGRTREKVSAVTGQDAPGALGQIVKTVMKKK